MSSYIIRLDDACPRMNHENWSRIELLMDKYNIRPIVGVIPDNRDPDFMWDEDKNFWEKVRNWQGKGWSIALHGLHHKMYEHKLDSEYFQKSHGVHTEFAGTEIEKQREMLTNGLRIMKENGVFPNCFFAPAHTYDANTVAVLRELPEIQFISDGYAIKPYKKQGMIFIPSICDGPITMPFGLYTFVFHPSVMENKNFYRLEAFLAKNYEKVIDTNCALEQVNDHQGMLDVLLENGIYVARGIRCFMENNSLGMRIRRHV